MHSTHFIYSYMEGRKEGNVLLNDTLNTFYLQLYGRKEGRKCFIERYTQHILFTVIWKEGNVLLNDALNTFYLRLYGRKEGNVLLNDALNTFYLRLYGRKEGNVLFNDTLNTFYLRLYGVGHMVKDYSDSERGKTHCRHVGYSFRLTARVLLCAPSHR